MTVDLLPFNVVATDHEMIQLRPFLCLSNVKTLTVFQIPL